MDGLAGFEFGAEPGVHVGAGVEAFEMPEADGFHMGFEGAGQSLGVRRCEQVVHAAGLVFGVNVLDGDGAGEEGLHGGEIDLRGPVRFAAPVVKHDGHVQRPRRGADGGAFDVGEDLGAETGVERAFDHGTRLTLLTGLTGGIAGLVAGGAEAREALFVQGVVALMGFAGVIARGPDRIRGCRG